MSPGLVIRVQPDDLEAREGEELCLSCSRLWLLALIPGHVVGTVVQPSQVRRWSVEVWIRACEAEQKKTDAPGSQSVGIKSWDEVKIRDSWVPLLEAHAASPIGWAGMVDHTGGQWTSGSMLISSRAAPERRVLDSVPLPIS